MERREAIRIQGGKKRKGEMNWNGMEWKGGNILEAQVSKVEKDCWEQ